MAKRLQYVEKRINIRLRVEVDWRERTQQGIESSIVTSSRELQRCDFIKIQGKHFDTIFLFWYCVNCLVQIFGMVHSTMIELENSRQQ